MEFTTQDIKRMSQIAEKMKGKSEDQVITELVQMIKSGQSGITPERAEQMISMLAPMLDNAQKKKLDKLLRELRK